MTSRERVTAALNHEPVDRVPLDVGATHNSGIHAYALKRLKKRMGLDPTVCIFDPILMTGVIDEDFADTLGSDCVALDNPFTLMGYRNENWKSWTAPNGEAFMVGGGFQYVEKGRDIYIFPQGDRAAEPSARMTTDEPFFSAITRQSEIDEDNMDARRDYAEDNVLLSDVDLRYYEDRADKLWKNTELAIVGSFYGAGLGDIAHVQAPGQVTPKGIRDITEWMMAPYLYPDYVHEVFDFQTEYIIENLKLYHQAVGEKICCIALAGTDFGSQRGLLYSKDIYREFYKPYFTEINAWVHKNTTWKTWYHSCGSVHELFDDFIESGYDVINPIQITASGMDPMSLKKSYGDKLVFWGGAVDPQNVLPFGTPEEVYEHVRKNISVLSEGSGYVCSPIHNITAEVPAENILALCKAVKGQSLK